MVDEGSLRPLSSIQAGREVQLEQFLCNGRVSLRLAELGLNRSTKITVLRSEPGQPLVLLVRESRLALDRRTADQLLVQPLP